MESEVDKIAKERGLTSEFGCTPIGDLVPYDDGVPQVELKVLLAQMGWEYQGDMLWKEPTNGKVVIWQGVNDDN